jgi:hypothetical protein
MDDYQKANLHWLLKNLKRRFPYLDTGDWFMELFFLTQDAPCRPNQTDEQFDEDVAWSLK